jgi:hypothetical protein
MRISRQRWLLSLVTALVVGMAVPVLASCRAAVQSGLNENGGAKMAGHANDSPGAESTHAQATLISRSAGPIMLGADPVRISLSPGDIPGKGLAARLDTLESGRSIYLVLRDLSTVEQPGVLYHVYLDLPATGAPEKNDPHYVDSISFFDAGGAKRTDGSSFRSFDIASVARTLKARKLLADQTSITIVPGGVPDAEAKPTIGRIEVIEQ